jgi:hypothetical protein
MKIGLVLVRHEKSWWILSYWLSPSSPQSINQSIKIVILSAQITQHWVFSSAVISEGCCK